MNWRGIAILIFLLLSIDACKDDPNSPVAGGEKDPRTYTWTVDTLKYPGSFQTFMRDIWSNSAKEVYVVGFNDQNKGKIWNLNGDKWSTVPITSSEGGMIQGAFNLVGIYGFSSDDIWAVGEKITLNPNPPPNFLDSSLVIHYDGSQWRESQLQRGRSLQAIWGSSPSSIWVAGLAGTVYFYDGATWERKKIRDDINFNGFTGNSSSDVYATGYKVDEQPIDSIHYYIYHYNGSQWTLRDSLIANTFPPQHSFGISGVWALNESEVYSYGYGIYQKASTGWSKIFDDGSLFGDMYGTTSNSIFAVGSGGIYHFNGTNWYQYPQFQTVSYSIIEVWVTGEEVFAVGTDGYISFILHGK